MKKTLLFTILLISTSLHAKLLISPYDAMYASYGKSITITKKNILLNKTKAKNVSQSAKAKLTSKIFRVFTAKIDDEVVGYGILISKVMRTKSAVVLYLVSKDSLLKSIEIISFNEPPEYIPSNTWSKQFENLPVDTRLVLTQNIPKITGATLSARAIVDGSRIALAFYEEILKGK
ncbi:FMN-binding protein [Sulfurimonas sp.]|nr:FMN-binding protein [Sulfurimonas sp.]